MRGPKEAHALQFEILADERVQIFARDDDVSAQNAG